MHFNKPDKLIRIDLALQDTNLSCSTLIDSGASHNAISHRLFEALNRPFDTQQRFNVTIAGGYTMVSKGTVEVTLKVDDVVFFSSSFIVLPKISQFDVIVGLPFLKRNEITVSCHRNGIEFEDSNCTKWFVSGVPNQEVHKTFLCKAAATVELTSEINKVPILVDHKLKDAEISRLWLYSDSGMSSRLCGQLNGLEGLIDLEKGEPAVLLNKADDCSIGKISYGETVGTLTFLSTTESESVNLADAYPCKEDTAVNIKELIQEPSLPLGDLARFWKMLEEVKQVFSKNSSDIGNMKMPAHKIELSDTTPIYQRPRHFPPPITEEIERQCQELQLIDVIEPSKSPWSSPVVPIRKPDGTIRLCVDYRRLNKVTISDKFPMPHLQDAVYSLYGVKYFTTLDLVRGYYQVPMDEESREFTAFTTSRNHYQFKRLSFGLKNAPATFQRQMQTVLSEFPWSNVIVYIDDILIMSKTIDQHLDLVGKVLSTLDQHNIKVKPEKCEFFKSEVDFLGHHISQSGISKQKKYMDKVRNYPKPETIRQIREFLGLVNFQRKFIPECSTIQKPLSALVGGKANQKITWTEEMTNSFEKLKEEISKEIELSYPNYNDEENLLELWVDASDKGAGASLTQVQDNRLCIIAYASTSFTDAQRKYSTLERELAGLRWAVKSFKVFLYGVDFVIWTDHQPLVYLSNMKLIDGRLARTLENLADFSFIIKYTPGKFNQAADALSRLPVKTSQDQVSSETLSTIPEGLMMNDQETPGGPDSMIQSVLKNLPDVTDKPIPKNTGELRKILVDTLLASPSKFGVELNRQKRKDLRSMKFPGQMPVMDLLLVCAHVYCIRILVHYGESQPISYEPHHGNRESLNNLHLQCIGGVHFNALLEKKSYFFNDQMTVPSHLTCMTSKVPLDFPDEHDPDVGESAYCHHDHGLQPIVSIDCEGNSSCALLDSGSEISIVRNKIVQTSDWQVHYAGNINLEGQDGSKSPILGFTERTLSVVGVTPKYTINLAVVNDQAMPYCLVLGIDFLIRAKVDIKFTLEDIYVNFAGLNIWKPLKRTVENNNESSLQLGSMFNVRTTLGSHPLFTSEVKYIGIGTPDSNLAYEVIYDMGGEFEGLMSRFDVKTLQKIQKKCQILSCLKEYLTTDFCNWPDNIERFKRFRKFITIENDMLVFVHERYKLFIVPFPLLVELILVIHYNFAHIGRDKILNLVQQNVWHPSAYKVASDVCTTCGKCQLMKIGAVRVVPPTLKIKTEHPYELMAADLLSLPTTPRGYIGCLNVIDHYSKWAISVPIKNKKTSTICDIFRSIIFSGALLIPRKLLTDNGMEFSSTQFEELLQEFSVQHLFTTPLHPSSNGVTERFNRTLIQMLRAEVDQPYTWDLNLTAVMQLYNNTVHSETQRSPTDLILTESHNTDRGTLSNVTNPLIWREGHPSFLPYQKGERVLKKIENTSYATVKKLTNKYTGPYEIIKVNPNGVTYVLMDGDREIRAHHTQLKLWTDSPTYIKNHPYWKRLQTALRDERPSDVRDEDGHVLNTDTDTDYTSSNSTSDTSETESDEEMDTQEEVVVPRASMSAPAIVPGEHTTDALDWDCSFHGPMDDPHVPEHSTPKSEITELPDGNYESPVLKVVTDQLERTIDETCEELSQIIEEACSEVICTVLPPDGDFSFSGFDINISHKSEPSRPSSLVTFCDKVTDMKATLRSRIVTQRRKLKGELLAKRRGVLIKNNEGSSRRHTRSKGPVPDYPHVLPFAL